MARTVYCRSWNEVTKEPSGPLSPAAARELHEKRRVYCAYIEDGTEPVVVQMTFFKAFCIVHFLDALKRVELRYSFEDVGERLFLSQATLHHYVGSEDFPSGGETYRFAPDGTIMKSRTTRGAETVVEQGLGDVSRNYSVKPRFGEYGGVTKRER